MPVFLRRRIDILQAIKDAGADDVEKAREAMAKLSFNGVSGKITFDENHNPIKSAVVMQVKDGAVTFHSVVNP